jgi:hypothetical protein
MLLLPLFLVSSHIGGSILSPWIMRGGKKQKKKKATEILQGEDY